MLLACSNARRTSWEYGFDGCTSTSSAIDCGFILNRSTPYDFITRSFSRVMVSGLPASTVYSCTPSSSKAPEISLKSLSSCDALIEVGVPPPIYTEVILRPNSFTSSPLCRISSHNFSRYGSISCLDFSISLLTNEQYEHRVGQRVYQHERCLSHLFSASGKSL